MQTWPTLVPYDVRRVLIDQDGVSVLVLRIADVDDPLPEWAPRHLNWPRPNNDKEPGDRIYLAMRQRRTEP